MIFTLLFFLLFTFLIVRLTRHSASGFTKAEVLLSFGFKVLMACAYGYVFLHYYGGDDTWQLNVAGQHEHALLMKDPGEFFWEITPATAWRNANGNGWLAFRLYLADLEYSLIAKSLGIFNILSRGNYYTNAVFFSFFTFWGHYWLFTLLTGLFPQKRKVLLLLIFFFPPVVFWLSGIRADGLLLMFLSLLLLQTWKWLYLAQKKSLVYICLGLAGILILRDVMVLLLLPGLAGWYVAVRYRRSPPVVLGIVYGISILLFFTSAYVPGVPNLPSVVIERQQEFLALKGNTRFALTPLEPGPGSFIKVLPQAVSNTFLRPFLWEARGMLQVMAAVELLLFWGLAVLVLVRGKKGNSSEQSRSLIWVMLCFSLSLYLFIGYVTPFPGAIVRYKIIPELLLLALLVIRIPFNLSWSGRRR
ncbi:hypothetical protein D3H65_14810 [Paraflavitalea soli]|uniref:Glycosyltransferase RgtA/B/C/D-like domain-containing protein n=1 Tax=Paraflavitalea soli TaxID=2315862 RepID=A0A3B7ML21_9BACT|nr:hypothetical protein [Paraflavitalea soli]AXY75172.1 hypothetical protein D3H65_14810 [Paraflavitalea soli]